MAHPGGDRLTSVGGPTETIDEQVARAMSILDREAVGGRDGDVELRGAVDVVRELVSRLEAMLEHTTDMITVVAADGTIRYSNRAAGELTGHDESVNGTEAFAFIHPEDLDSTLDAFLRCAGTPGAVEVVEFRLRYADGSWRPVEAYAKNCLDDRVAGIVVSMRDISDRKAAEAALVDNNEAMKDFVAVASHELRTPTTVIRGFASTLQRRWDDLDDMSKREFVDAVARSAQRLSRLVDDLLIVSRIDADGATDEAELVDVGESVLAAVDEMGGEGSIVRVDIDVDGAPRAFMAPHHLRRIVRNLLENAIRYGQPPVEISAREVGGAIEVRVSDHGEGVPPEFVTRLFERFARADTAVSREKGGTGLGLSIVRGLVQANGGEVGYEPAPSGGACFVVRLPLAP